MIFKLHTTLTVLILAVTVISGCYLQTYDQPQDEKPAQQKESADQPEVQTSEKEELMAATFDEKLSNLSVSERLDSTAKLLETATGYLSDKQLVTAGYYLSQASHSLSLIDITSMSDENGEFYQDLVTEINNFYKNFVTGLEVLPEEVPSGVIMAGLDEAEGDTVSEDFSEIIRPEVTFDSAAVGEALDTIPTLPDVPLVRNIRVENAIRFFQGKGRKVYTKWMQRGGYYIPIMKKILREQGLPEDLVYVAMIESGFKTDAYSYAHASGPWQFISSTARIFDMKSDWWYDERRDPIKSTYAASRYLKKLYTDFDDWYLALASYNCGEGKVRRHIRTYNTRDFWQLNRLPRQTRNYLPSYIAATIIAKDPTAYGFDDWVYQDEILKDSLEITESVDLEVVADFIGSNYEEIKQLNPAMVRWCTPPNLDKVTIYLPLGTAEKFSEGLKNLPARKKHKWIAHKVRTGEALSTIARRYGTTPTAIRALKENNIRNVNRIKAGQTIFVPVPPEKYKKTATEYHIQQSPPPDREKVIYKVHKGDNLSTIAERYGTSVSALKRWNNLYRNRFIFPGQKLTIWTKKGTKPAPATIVTEKGTFHIVQSGESLSSISTRFGTTIKRLADLNHLTAPYKIKKGERLLITDAKSQITASNVDTFLYTIKKGDTLWDISLKHKTSIAELKRINGIGNHKHIKPGDTIEIPSK